MIYLPVILSWAPLLAAPVFAAPANSSKACSVAKGSIRTTPATTDICIDMSLATAKTSLSPSASRDSHSHTPTAATTSLSPAPSPTGFDTATSESIKSTETNSATSTASKPLSTSSGSTPRFVVYTDSDSGATTKNRLPAAEDLKGFNVLAISFWITHEDSTDQGGAADQATNWASMSTSDRKAAKKAYNEAGISVIVSAFGATSTPTTSGYNPTQLASTIADFVKTYDLDGVDVDYEDFDAINNPQDKGKNALNWLVSFTKALRNQLPAGQYTISHAPVAPWFSETYYRGGYLYIDKEVGSLIDWYNVQFYNQGDGYTDCDALISKAPSRSSDGTPTAKTSVLEIANAGVDKNKIVIGKVGVVKDADSGGYMDPSELGRCVKQANLANGWNAGVMGWEYPTVNTQWIAKARGTVFPLSG